ncbi:hypothetical protein KEM48_006755 [Puccinia striiformis f. sp. tritici PST-130]|nr:hypothetical protein KEM48_006755 [Puccinia striiformis f. sp. tritici PST-130]
MACLRDIKRLFGQTRSPFYAGFGNRITDALSYRAVDIPSSRIFTIDSNGEVKMELLELTGYKSSYIHMTDLLRRTFTHRGRSGRAPLSHDASQSDLECAERGQSHTASRLTFRLSSLTLGRKSSKVDLPGSSGTLKSMTGTSRGSFLTLPSSKQSNVPASFQNEPESLIEQDERTEDHAIGSGSDDDDHMAVPAVYVVIQCQDLCPGASKKLAYLKA